MSEREAKKLVTRLNNVFESIYTLTNRAGNLVYYDFQKLPPRTGTDYYKFITKPISLHTIGRTVKRFSYRDAQGFIDDLAQITWNARHYNEPGSEIYENALVLDKFIKETAIPKLASDPIIPNASSLHYPDLGPLDDYGNRFDDDGASGSPFIKNEDYDDDEVTHHGRYGANKMYKSQDGAVRRGRPPIIDKPYESRIKSILKSFKRIRHPDDENHILTMHFERLPDKSLTSYYDTIPAPISLHEIRAKVRSRKYTTVEQFLDDLALMISNAKLYNAGDPGMTNDIILFEQQMQEIIEREMSRPEKDFIVATSSNNESLKTPLDSVTVNNHTYKVGDWVLIRNPNDDTKPICGQIFRLWSADGVQYTNVCWYVRPEQTCHRVDRLFYINEVCKTGEYSDHRAEDIVSPCYVIFLTHYQKGDIPPNLLPNGAEWFICEFRYNANTYAFNRIRTWKACLPDEIRHVDQPIVPINEPRKLIKYDSPIKHLLQPNSDDMSQVHPTEGHSTNGPPVVGAVFQKPPYYNDELGQCSTSPNVARAPEYDDVMSGRLAYIFKPMSQMKSITGAGVHSSSGTRTVAASYTPGQADDYALSYDSPSQAGTPQHYSQHTPVPSGYAHGLMGKPYGKSDMSMREGTPTQQLGNHYVTPSIYSHVLPGGVVSYVEKKEEDAEEGKDVKSISESVITSSGNPVWFRAPPAKINEKLVTPVGHSAKYLAWKLKKSQKV